MSADNRSTNQIVMRHCYRVRGRLAAPLLAGSGEDLHTDMDAILDAQGNPYLPGSALAGALRHAAVLDERQRQYLFGDEVWNASSGVFAGWRSRLFVYDMCLQDARLRVRDGVRLNDWKAAQDQAKYDYQIVEPGAEFIMRLQLIVRKDDECDGQKPVSALLSAIQRGEVAVGAKTRRGLGRLTIDEVLRRDFDLRTDYAAWLDWDWEKDDAFAEAEAISLEEQSSTCYHCLRLPLQLKSTLLIRDYALPGQEEGQPDAGAKKVQSNAAYAEKQEPDAVPLSANGHPVIPGSSWMGAIRARLAHILRQMTGKSWQDCQAQLAPAFGSWPKEQGEALRASAVTVAESTLRGGRAQLITRNAIDRFTGGTVDGALFTNQVQVGGDTELALRWPAGGGDGISSEAICGLLLWALDDLQSGLLALGGETAVGRGVFAAVGALTLDGEPLAEEAMTPYLAAAAAFVREGGKAK